LPSSHYFGAANDEAIGCQTAERTGDVQTDSPIDPIEFDEQYELAYEARAQIHNTDAGVDGRFGVW
jgi:hypothetical protein